MHSMRDTVTRTCTEAFKGTIIHSSRYIITSPKAGDPATVSLQERQKFGLAYDSVLTFAHALDSLIKSNTTADSHALFSAMKRVSFYGLTGRISLGDTAERKGYLGSMNIINPEEGETGKEKVLQRVKFLSLPANATPSSITPTTVVTERLITGAQIIYAALPESTFNTVKIRGLTGTVTPDNIPVNANDYEIDLDEKVPPAYFCSGGCGGLRELKLGLYDYSNGKCVMHETCKCKLNKRTGKADYTGTHCSITVCNECHFGKCVIPNVCQCFPGYDHSNTKKDCSSILCNKYGCDKEYGNCTSPNYCSCISGHYSKDCSKVCTCRNGRCNEGESGDGLCLECYAGYFGQDCDKNTFTTGLPVAILLALVLLGVLYLGWKRYKQALCRNQANWKGKEVIVKLLGESKLELDYNLRWAIKRLRDTKHQNLCAFIGAVIEPPHAAVLMEVCVKGSIRDLLSNEDIELSWDFKYSMLKDICRGMQYLCSTDIGSHGRLTSSNCLVDARWNVKIADYGLQEFRRRQKNLRFPITECFIGIDSLLEEEVLLCDYRTLLWTAPENLLKGVTHIDDVGAGTEEGDVYSLSMIMAELCTHRVPYSEYSHLPTYEIVQMVGGLRNLDPAVEITFITDCNGFEYRVLRPSIFRRDLPADNTHSKAYRRLMKDCWTEIAEERPTFSICLTRFNDISPFKGELIDNLIVLMEQYTRSLEMIVAERTQKMVLEKERNDHLLSKMLPRVIAEELKSGNKPNSELFNCVTVYFSDIVGFDSVCNIYRPLQVVKMLNDLYYVMDDVIESFDVYKVETIADCYMLVSGLPVRNWDRHASEISTLSLHLLSAVKKMGSNYNPDSKVQLRIGIHSGPCVAGVVGLKMPRYCLFGDTVNAAARMLTTGSALKIHVSEDTHRILERIGGYKMECRGERDIKGRGTMTTYWLESKEGLNLQYLNDTVTPSQCNFNLK